jgi:hypothetical protein
MTREEAYTELPVDAERSSCFGNPGEAGFVEYFRTPAGERFKITNGAWDAPVLDWKCERSRLERWLPTNSN